MSKWAEDNIIQMVGIPLDQADAELRALAKVALDRCYYLDRAARELATMLRCKCPTH